MTLATHAIVGASLAALVPDHPVTAFVMGFASHFVLDAIPHWDYKLASASIDEKNMLNNDLKLNHLFFYDLLKICLDISLGFALVFIVFSSDKHFSGVILSGAAGAVIPDFLQFVYFKLRKGPIVLLQRFHIWIHAGKNLNGQPIIGIISQAAVAALAVILSRVI